MRRGARLIHDHNIKGHSQSLLSAYETLWAWYKLQYVFNILEPHTYIIDYKRRNYSDFVSQVHG